MLHRCGRQGGCIPGLQQPLCVTSSLSSSHGIPMPHQRATLEVDLLCRHLSCSWSPPQGDTWPVKAEGSMRHLGNLIFGGIGFSAAVHFCPSDCISSEDNLIQEDVSQAALPSCQGCSSSEPKPQKSPRPPGGEGAPAWPWLPWGGNRQLAPPVLRDLLPTCCRAETQACF